MVSLDLTSSTVQTVSVSIDPLAVCRSRGEANAGGCCSRRDYIPFMQVEGFGHARTYPLAIATALRTQRLASYTWLRVLGKLVTRSISPILSQKLGFWASA